MFSYFLNKIIPVLLKYWYIAVIVICLTMMYFMFGSIKSKNIEIARKTSNIEVLNSKFEQYKVLVHDTIHGKDTLIHLNVAKVIALSYTIDELKQYNAQAVQTIKDLNLKLKNVQSVTDIGTQTNQTIITPTIKTDSTTCFNYQDEFLKLSGCVINNKNSAQITYQNSDHLTIIPSGIVKHHFLFWSWGIKGIQLDVLSKNPNTTFTYENYIDLTK